jgi:hypothetical protein
LDLADLAGFSRASLASFDSSDEYRIQLASTGWAQGGRKPDSLLLSVIGALRALRLALLLSYYLPPSWKLIGSF